VVGAAVAVIGRGAEVPVAGVSHSLAAGLPERDPLGPPPRSGLAIPRPRLLTSGAAEITLWAPVRRAVAVHEAPSARADVTAHVPASTPERTTNIVVIAGSTRGERELWVPIRTRAATGWVPRDALGGYEAVETRLLVDTAAFTATLLRANRVVFRARIGVGTAAAPTPTGSFYVRNRLTRYRSAFYGPVSFGTSARSGLTDWPAGGFVGIHGTSRPEILPGRVSHGCIRMRNADILALARLMPVGTPVEIT